MKKCIELREIMLPAFPPVRADNFDVSPDVVMRDFVHSAKLSKSFMAYLIKMDRVGDQFFSISQKNDTDKLFILDTMAHLSEFICALVTRSEHWYRDESLFNRFNQIMIHLSMMQLLYAIKFIDSYSPGYLEKVFSDASPDAICLSERLFVTFKAFRLTEIFSHNSFSRISATLKAVNYVQN